MSPLLSLPAGVSRRQAIFALSLLSLLWLWVAVDRPYSLPHHLNWNIYSNSPEASDSDTEDAFDFPPLDSEAVRSVCADTTWNASLVFTCANSVGGIGNIRNSILNCVRYAISAGASLVEPQIIMRDAEDTTAIRTRVRTDMDYMLDSSHFRESLRLSCPGLILYGSLDDVPGSLHEPISVLPEILEGDNVPASGLEHPEAWRDSFYSFLSEHLTLAPGSKAVIDQQRSYLKYPIYTDGESFALAFGKILKFRRDTRYLATQTLKALAQITGYAEDRGFALDTPILPDFFMGVHLRTERDAREGWPAQDWVYGRYETQAKYYLEQANSTSLKHIYIASGEAAEIEKFRVEASALGLTVHTKTSVLSQVDLETLNSLSWDQQGMVDFLVMLKASDFAGVAHSSFAWNIALLRHIHAKKKDHLQGPQSLSDELSQIYGTPYQYPEYAACLWP